MPIQSVPDGVLDVENATLRASGMVATKDMVIGKTAKKTSDVPTLEVFSEGAATIELQSNLARSTNTSNAFARIKADSQALTFESGSGLAHDSKGDIVFSSVGDATKHMVIKGSTGKIGIGVENPSSALDIAGDISLIGQNAKIKMNSDVLVEHAGPHGRDGAAVLKKYPEIAFDASKVDGNDTTNTYVQAGYTVSASTTYSTHRAFKVFNGVPNDFFSWQNGSFSNSDGTYSGGTQTFESIPGEWLKIEVPNKIKPASINLYRRDFDGQSPKDFKIYASITGSSWNLLTEQTGIDNWTNAAKSYNFDTGIYYKYFAILVTKITRTNSAGAQTSGTLGELEIYGYEEDPPLGDTSVDTTFTSIMNTPQTTGANVYVDGSLGETFTNRVTGPTTISNTHTTYDSTGKYWELTGELTSNVTLEANTFLEGDQPHAVSVWFNSSNLEANVSNTCVFSVSDQEKLDSVNLDLQSNTWHNLTYAYQGEGGSRVTYLDGRKVAEDQAEDTFGEYPPFAMTGYSQGGYVVSQSSVAPSTGREAWKAFDNDNTTHFEGNWNVVHYEANTGNVDGGQATTMNVDGSGTYQGEWIQIEFPHKIVVSYYELRNRVNFGYRLPENAKLLGSNDDINWTTVYNHSDTGGVYTAAGETRSFGVGSNRGYKYFRLVINKLFTNTSSSTSDTPNIASWKIYGHRENDLVRLPDPTNVLKYPHVALSGPAQRGYVASASSEYLLGGSTTYQAWEAFNNIAGSQSQSWLSTGLANTYGGAGSTYGTVRSANLGSDSGGTATPENGEWLKIQMPHALIVSHIRMKGTGDTTAHPKTFKLYGSNNGTSWNEILSVVGASTLDATGTQFTPTSTPDAYNYFGLVVTANHGRNSYVEVSELQFYGTEEASSVPIQIGGGNIDRVANFRVYDKFVGEDQALEIWDAQKDEFGRAKSSMTLQKGRLGIGTTEPEGRLAVADEPDPDAYGFQEFPPRGMGGYKTSFEGHGEFCVSASSEHGDAIFDGWYAFDKGYTSTGGEGVSTWISGYDPIAYNSSGVATGSFGVINGVNGEYLILESPYKIKMDHVLIYPRAHTTTTFSYSLPPKDGKIWGRNTIDEPWTEIVSYTNLSYGATRTDNLYGQIPTRVNINATQYYKYIAFQITATNTSYGGSVTYTNYTNLKELRYFGYREQLPPKQSVLHDGQLTLTKNLNVPRIGPALDADDTPRRDRLVVEYNTSTNPTFDGAVRDTSGRGNDGVFYGGASYDATEKALVFNGTASNYITRSQIGNSAGAWVHSFSTWVNTNDITYNHIFSIGVDSDNDTSTFRYDEGNGTKAFRWFFYGNDICWTYSGALLNTWIHVVGVYDGGAVAGSRRLWVNGVELTTQSEASGVEALTLPANTQLTLGERSNRSGTQTLNGEISNFKLYDTVLTTEEVKTLYDMGRCDEGHHVVNFSKTRVGIGLGDGEAPTYTLDVRGQIRSDGSLVTSFTGQHKCIPEEPMEKGLIVSAKKNQFVKLNGLAIGKSAITIDESLPIVSLSNVAQDKACFGVVSSTEEANTTFRVETTNGGVISTIPKTLGDNRAIVNSVGEGAIWVVDTGGSLESGDYITTSNVAGYGQRQESEFLANYTVAKITMDCDFTGSNVAVQTIKREETGTRTITEDTWNQLVDYDRSSNTETQYSNTLVSSDYSGQSGYTPREVTTIMDYTDGSNLISIDEWSNLESNIQNTYQSNTFTEIVDYTKFVSFSEWSNLTAETQNTYSEAEITTYYQIQRGENVLDENGQLQFEDKTGATEAPYERRFLDVSGAQTDEANAVHIAAFVGCTYHCG